MSAEWPEISLADIYEIRSGLSKPASAFGSGYPFLSFKEVFGNYFVPESLSNLVQSSESERLAGSIKRGDVFLTRTSETIHELGMSCVALKDFDCATFNGFTKRLRLKEEAGVTVYPEYVGYYLRSSRFRRDMLAFSTMSTRASLNNEMIGKLTIILPPLEIQEKIASTLKFLDDKVRINQSINEILEDIVQATFKSWFVNFDPVRAKISAIEQRRDPLRAAICSISGKDDSELDLMAPERYKQLADFAKLFTDQLDESSLGDLPRDWSIQTAEMISSVGIGKTPPRKEPQWFTEYDGDWRWVSIRDMGKDGLFQQTTSEFLTAEAVSQFNVKVVPGNTVLLSFKLTMGRVSITDGPMVTNEAIAHFKLPVNPLVTTEYLYLYLKNFDYSVLGSTSSIANAVNSKTIREIPVICPPKELVSAFDQHISSIFQEIKNRQSEMIALLDARDTLLPKLLSGEIGVPV